MDAVADSDLFDATLEQAVHAFQVRHGLEADGIVGRRTRGAMNVTAAERVRQLEINLQRLRARSDSLPVPRIEINIAAQRLRYFDTKGDVLEMRTIVGRRDWPTPIFEAKAEAIVLAPYWNVPTRIASLEVIPAIRRDPGYLARNDMEVVTTAGRPRIVDPATIDWSKSFPHRIRQRPGPRNPLGEVKFLLPNRFDVYLHDTPGRAAFQRADRALSHGCVRLERALDLAAALLAGRPESAADSMRTVIDAGREHTIRLDHSVPVIFYYQTAWVERDGTVNFREDIYGHDRRAAPRVEPASHESECAA
jgi:murein L,D-transpeptidase YcbB/YkuD